MEITEELRQYFAQTERHREEPRRRQRLDKERLGNYVYADPRPVLRHAPLEGEPPAERPGEQHAAEMKRLYGDGATTIQAMEAAMQLSFDKYFDRKPPKYWSIIPLKF